MPADTNDGYEIPNFTYPFNHGILFITPSTDYVILNCLKNLKPKKTMRLDEITAFDLHDCPISFHY